MRGTVKEIDRVRDCGSEHICHRCVLTWMIGRLIDKLGEMKNE